MWLVGDCGVRPRLKYESVRGLALTAADNDRDNNGGRRRLVAIYSVADENCERSIGPFVLSAVNTAPPTVVRDILRRVTRRARYDYSKQSLLPTVHETRYNV